MDADEDYRVLGCFVFGFLFGPEIQRLAQPERHIRPGRPGTVGHDFSLYRES